MTSAMFVVLFLAVCGTQAAFSGVLSVSSDSAPHHQYSSAIGEMDHGVPMVPSAKFFIGSNSKLFASVAMYQLEEMGLVDLHRDIGTYLTHEDFVAFGRPDVTTFCPTLLNNATCQAITFTDLMSMGSGIIDAYNCDYPPSSPFIRYCQPTGLFVPSHSIAATVGTFLFNPLTFIPGTNYSYANPNFILLSYFVEKFSGVTFAQYLLNNITNVIGLSDTFYDRYNQQFSTTSEFARAMTTFYDPSDTSQPFSSGDCPLELDPSVTVGTGGLVSTVPDMTKWYFSLFNRKAGGSPLFRNASTIHTMLRKWNGHNPQQPRGVYYAQGVVVWYEGDANTTWPDFIVYEGGTVCHHTANILDLRDPAVAMMSMAYRNANVYYVGQDTWTKASEAADGNFFQLTAGWNVTSDAMDVAWGLHNRFRPPPAEPRPLLRL